MAYKLKYSDYSTTASGPPDPAAWVGPPGPSGPAGPPGPGGPFLPLSGGSVDSPTTELSTTIATNWTTCYPVANSTWPASPASPGVPAVQGMLVAQSQTAAGANQAEWTAVFGNYINSGQPNGQKVTVYAGAVQGPLGGSTWSLNSNVIRNGVPNNAPGGPSNVGSGGPGTPGAIPVANSTIGYELDFSNYDQDGVAGTGPFTVGLFLTTASIFASTAGIYYGSTPLNAGHNNYGWHDGILFQGAYTIQDNTIYDATNASYSYRAEGTHVVTFLANDTAQYAFQANGNHTIADFWTSDNAPAVLKVSGTHTYVIDLAGSTVTGATCNGVFSASSLATGSVSGPTWTTGSAAPSTTQPVGSLYSRVGGAVGATLYVSRGGGTWAAVASV